MAKTQHSKWLRLVGKDENKYELNCPNCGHSNIHFQYVGDTRSRIGFLDIWCDYCIHGIHISRTKIPERVDMISFEEEDEYNKRVTKFIIVERG
jgi:hypothetical protein